MFSILVKEISTYRRTEIHNRGPTFNGLLYFYEMAKNLKSEKSKMPASYKIDPDLYKKATEKCLKESLVSGKRITLSAKVEELIREWVAKKV